MQIFTHSYKDIHPGYPIEQFAPLDSILFIDIETTGLSREHTNLYLIGCGHFDSEGYNTIQWFADSPDDEKEVIRKFSDFIAGRFRLLMHYNGNHFDIPYLKFKADKHGLKDPFDTLDTYDIYSKLKPYKKLLGLQSMRQRCIEQLLGINSDDPYTGRDLISVYHGYIKSPDDASLNALIYHNSEDLKGMSYILPALYYTTLKDAVLEYTSHSLHEFTDFNGCTGLEIIAEYRHNADIPKSFTAKYGKLMLSMRTDRIAKLRIPVIKDTLKQFYDNYRDYYYLPAEDCCIHKSAASGVDKTRRENAKKETCYTKYSGLFIPCIITGISPVFKESFNSSDIYSPFTDSNAVGLLTDIGRELLHQVF